MKVSEMTEVFEKEHQHACASLLRTVRLLTYVVTLSYIIIDATVRCFRLACKKMLGLDLGTEDECSSEPVAFCFWHNQDQNLKTLPDVCLDGLRSAIHRGRFKVSLLSYQSLEGVPDGVNLLHAAEFLQASFKLNLFPHQLVCTMLQVANILSFDGRNLKRCN